MVQQSQNSKKLDLETTMKLVPRVLLITIQRVKKESIVSPLRSLQEVLHNRITQKKGEMHRTNKRSDTDHLRTEIEKLQWLLSKS